MRFRGTVYRALDPRWSWPPTSGEGARLHGGRFNRVGRAALYTSSSPITALREATGLRYPMQPTLLCAYEVDAEPVFDALDAADLSAQAVAEVELRCPGWEEDTLDGRISDSQSLADRLIAAGYVGMRVPSFAPGAAPGARTWCFGVGATGFRAALSRSTTNDA